MKIKYLVIIFLVVGLGTLVGYRIHKNSESENKLSGSKKGNAAKSVVVNGIVLQSNAFTNFLSLTGSIEANEQVEIRSQISGIINAIYFKEGSVVEKGQAMVKIDDAELRARLAEAETRQGLAKENERRARLLLEKEGISREEYETSLAELKSLQAQTQLTRAQLDKTVIRAPFSGTVGLRFASVGQYLSPETIVANLVNSNPVKITFSVPEKYANQVKVNTELNFTIAGSDKKFKAKVYAKEPRIDADTRTLALRAMAENPEGLLVPGSFANIELPLATLENAVLVPTEAVIPIQNGKKVFVTDNGKAKEAIVETSTRTEKELLVTSGLKPGDTVLTTGIMGLKSGTPVKVKIQSDEKIKTGNK